MSDSISKLKVDDEDFLVASLIDRCPKSMMLRELVKNAIEAASGAPPGQRRVVIGPAMEDGAAKLRIWNTGSGMDEPQLHAMCDLASSIGKAKGLDANFGMGAKVASLPSNHMGVRYRSCAGGLVHEVTIGRRNGAYGRVMRPAPGDRFLPGTMRLVDIADVTEEAVGQGASLLYDWTEVVLLGMTPEQNTATDPYNGDPAVSTFWLPEALYQRFFRLESEVEVIIEPDQHWLMGHQPFQPVMARVIGSFARYEAVSAGQGMTIHYLYDPPHQERPWENQSAEGALQEAVSQVGLVWRNEIYDARSGSPWAYASPTFGITFGARHISVYIELPDDAAVVSDTYRQFLRYRDASQANVSCSDYAALAVSHRPSWLNEVMTKLGGKSRVGDTLMSDFASLADELGVGRLSANGAVVASAPRILVGSIVADHVDARPYCGLEIVLLREAQDIRDRWLLGRAATFYPQTQQLFVNTLYASLEQLRTRLHRRVEDLSAKASIDERISEIAEEMFVRRLGRTMLFAIAKHLSPETWQSGHIEKAMSPETLSLAADDIEELVDRAETKLRREHQWVSI